jgi:putative effector of murein hydrolase
MSGRSSGRLREQLRPFVVALCAGGLYGSWAGFVHRGLGAGVAMCAGCTQVGLSMFTTLVFVLLLERLFRWPSNPVHGFWLAALVSSTLGAAWLGVGHAVAGTPHIAAAIAPSVIVGGVFDFVYAGRLLTLARRCADIGQGARNGRCSAAWGGRLATAESLT